MLHFLRVNGLAVSSMVDGLRWVEGLNLNSGKYDFLSLLMLLRYYYIMAVDGGS